MKENLIYTTPIFNYDKITVYFLFILLMISFAGCTISKRHYLTGYTVSLNSKLYINNKQDIYQKSNSKQLRNEHEKDSLPYSTIDFNCMNNVNQSTINNTNPNHIDHSNSIDGKIFEHNISDLNFDNKSRNEKLGQNKTPIYIPIQPSKTKDVDDILFWIGMLSFIAGLVLMIIWLAGSMEFNTLALIWIICYSFGLGILSTL